MHFFYFLEHSLVNDIKKILKACLYEVGPVLLSGFAFSSDLNTFESHTCHSRFVDFFNTHLSGWFWF